MRNTGFIGFLAVAALSACTARIGDVPSQDYTEFADTPASTSTLGGAAVNNATNATTTVAGTLEHATRDLTLTTPGGGTATILAGDFNGTYAFARPVSIDTGSATYTGVLGILTAPVDVAAALDATYIGEFEGALVTSGLTSLNDWDAAITADFAGRSVDAAFSGAGSAQLDEITVTGATISGSGYSGGTVQTLNGGIPVVVTGAGTTASFTGRFFGWDDAKVAPDETGGVVVIDGASGFITGTFIAD